MNDSKLSPALNFLTIMWLNGSKDAWTRVNRAMSGALRLAIAGGLRFDSGDLAKLNRFRPGRWIGDREYLYSLAVTDGNESFIAVWEEDCQREPFRANDVSFPCINGSCNHINHPFRQRDRLCLGATCFIEGEKWEVTGFDDAKGTIRFVSKGTEKRRLLKLTNAELKALCPAPKKPAKKKASE